MSPTARDALLQLTRCPECGAIAEIVRRVVLQSTDGPIEHVRMECVARHWFLLPTAAVADVVPPIERAAAGRRVRR